MRLLQFQTDIIEDICKKIFKPFEYDDKTAVIIGDNESGKTFLLKQISSELEKNDINVLFFDSKNNNTYIQQFKGIISTLSITPTFKTPLGTIMFNIKPTGRIEKDANYYCKQVIKKMPMNGQVVCIVDEYHLFDKEMRLAFLLLYSELIKTANPFFLLFSEDIKYEKDLLDDIKKNNITKFDLKRIPYIDASIIKEFANSCYPNLKLTNEEIFNNLLGLCNNSFKNLVKLLELLSNHKEIEITSNDDIITNILDSNLLKLEEIDRNLPLVLKIASIVEGYFSIEQLHDISSLEVINIEQSINTSKNKNLLIERSYVNEYDFSAQFIKTYFNKRVCDNFSQYYERYYDYLERNDNDNYYMRANILLLTKKTKSSEIFSLYLTSLSKQLQEYNNTNNKEEIRFFIKEFLEHIPNEYSHFKHIYDNLEKFYKLENDTSSLDVLNEMNMNISLIFNSEIAYLKLITYIKLFEYRENDKIIKYCDDLELIWHDLKENEKEQWLIIGITLMSVYANNLDDYIKSERIYNKINESRKKFNKSKHRQIFAILDRRSALYDLPTIAHETSIKSVTYYTSENKNDCELYLSLCNHSANLLVIGNYIDAKNYLEKAKLIYIENSFYNTIKSDRVELNYLLVNYLISEKEIFNSKDDLELNKKFTENIDHTISCMENYISQNTKVHKIFYLNLASFYAMKKDEINFEKYLSLLKEKIDNCDSFYELYIKHLYISFNIVNQNFMKANDLLHSIKDMECPAIYKKVENHIRYRTNCLSDIIENNEKLTVIEFNKKMLRTSSYKLGNYDFFYRAFLLSDIQYLSQ